MANLYHTLIYQPILNGLIALYHYLPIHDLGVAIIGITVVLLSVLYWPSLVQIRSSMSLQQLQPKLKVLQQKYGKDRQELAKHTMELYREHKFNPLSSCLPLLVQFPIFIALYNVLISGLSIDPTTHLLQSNQLDNLYGSLREIYTTTTISTTAFGFLNIATKHNIILALLVGGSQFILTKMLSPGISPPSAPGAKDEKMTTTIFKQMNAITPFTFAIISYILPAGLSLYYITWNLFQIAQRRLLQRNTPSPEVKQQ